MAKVKLGSREFDADCEEIAVPWNCGRISDAECVALGAQMRVGEFQRLRIMQLDNTEIADAGAISLGEGLKCNSSVQRLVLVSCGI